MRLRHGCNATVRLDGALAPFGDVLAGVLGGIGVLGVYGWLTRPGGVADDGRVRT